MCAIRANLLVVCHQLRSPDNLGAIARLLANFGFSQLTLSDPVTHAFKDAEKLAIGAEHVLGAMQVARDLREALGGAVYACATTSRASLKGRTPITPEQV